MRRIAAFADPGLTSRIRDCSDGCGRGYKLKIVEVMLENDMSSMKSEAVGGVSRLGCHPRER
jgi:hypothetical protein